MNANMIASILTLVLMNELCGIHTRQFSSLGGSLESIPQYSPSPCGSCRVTATSKDGSYGDGREAEAVSRENRLCEDSFLVLSPTN